MRRRLDLTIAQRLALGFGIAGALLAVLGGVSHLWALRIAALQRREADVIRPRAVAADRLESAVLYVATATRTYVLVHDDARLQAYQQALDGIHDDMAALEALPKDPDGRELYERFPALIDRYEQATRAMVEVGKDGPGIPVLEASMASAREALLAAVHGYAELQERKMDETLAAITSAAEDMDRAGLGLAMLVMALLVAIGWVTARSVRDPALALVGAARRLASGDYAPAVALAGGGGGAPPLRDELAELSQSFGRMALGLKVREERLRASSQLASSMASSLDPGRLCDAALEEVAGHLGVEVGAVYLLGEGATLRRRAGLGLAGEGEPLAVGEGIPGRAAASRRTVTAQDLPAGAPFSIHLGIDRLPPKAVAAAPMVLQNDQVAGVLLAASARPIPPEAIEFLEHAATQLAVSVQNALANERVQGLAAALQERNEKLQAQQEELQAQHEEIQAQNEEIQAQNEELQGQNEELQVQGEELRSHDEALRATVERLGASEEALRAADHHKNDFLAVLSHELRNPLAAIKNGLYLLERIPPGSEQARRAQRVIDRQVQQLARLVEDLLDLTRISRGKVQLQRATLELGALVRQAAEDNGAEFTERGIELAVQVASDVFVHGDPVRLAQVVGNLLQNAAKFTPRGGRVVVALEADGERARVRVQDSGAGMDRETLGRLFQPFMQGDMTLARTNGGLGLGLALVKGMVELHGGTVRAASDGPGRGAEFTVELPLSAPAAAPQRVRPSQPRAGRRILLVEDNADAAESLAEVLALGGHEVAIAYKGADGIEKARAFRPEVLLCDIGLPDMEGHDVARAFRGDPDLSSVYLVALSGYARPEDLRRAAEAGFHRHLAKPPDLDHLEELLATVRR